MTPSLNPAAVYDVLAITSGLDRAVGALFKAEIQTLAYLSCMLSVFDRLAASDWAYEFMGVPPLLPFSRDIDDAISRLTSSRHLSRADDGFTITARGLDEHALLGGLQHFQRRHRAIAGAVGAVLIDGVARVADSVSAEPGIEHAAERERPTRLLDESIGSALYEHFAVLRGVVGDSPSSGLVTPATVYLRFLQASREGATEVA